MGYNNVFRQLHGEITGETDKAIKFEFNNTPEPAKGEEDNEPDYRTEWFPLSQLQSIHRFSKPDNDLDDILMVSEWILRTKNILHLAGTTSKPVLSGTPTTVIPKIQDKLQHPPASSFVDMDDDIPF